jgi:FAD/FMN-containing dehydrogenase
MTEPVRLNDLARAFVGRLLTEDADTAPFLTDWRRRWTGRAIAVAQPDDAAGVAAILAWCHQHGVPVVTQGGNTGLSGGSVPDESGRALLLSTRRLNRIRAIDPANDSITAEAGCTLQQVQAAAAAASRLFPLSLAAEGSCTIGGNLATNAGGVHVLRYGTARALCLGLEVATASGEIWDGLRGLRKDNTGYDLRDLFIGSEGTLGVITAAVLRLYPAPASRAVAFVAVASPSAALQLLHEAQHRAGASLTACELMDALSLAFVLRHTQGARRPLDEPSPWYVLLEISSFGAGEPADLLLLSLLEHALSNEIATDAAVSASQAQFASLWALREGASDAQAAEGPTIKHDVALPVSALAGFVAAAAQAIAEQFPGLRPVVWGHVGDGNLHYNVSPPPGRCGQADKAWFLGQEAALNVLVHDLVAQRGGSISAEHGLGVLRRDAAAGYKSPVEMRLMQTIKRALDPCGIMNPGKLLV